MQMIFVVFFGIRTIYELFRSLCDCTILLRVQKWIMTKLLLSRFLDSRLLAGAQFFPLPTSVSGMTAPLTTLWSAWATRWSTLTRNARFSCLIWLLGLSVAVICTNVVTCSYVDARPCRILFSSPKYGTCYALLGFLREIWIKLPPSAASLFNITSSPISATICCFNLHIATDLIFSILQFNKAFSHIGGSRYFCCLYGCLLIS